MTLDFMEDVVTEPATQEDVAAATQMINESQVGFEVVQAGETVSLPTLDPNLLQSGEFPQEDLESLTVALETFIHFLKSNIIKDKFGDDHEKRRAFRNKFKSDRPQLTRAFEEVFETNRLRWRNNLGKVLFALSNLKTFKIIEALPDIPKTHFSELEGLYEKCPNNETYKTMSFDEKKQFANDVAEVLKKILRSLDERTPEGV